MADDGALPSACSTVCRSHGSWNRSGSSSQWHQGETVQCRPKEEGVGGGCRRLWPGAPNQSF